MTSLKTMMSDIALEAMMGVEVTDTALELAGMASRQGIETEAFEKTVFGMDETDTITEEELNKLIDRVECAGYTVEKGRKNWQGKVELVLESNPTLGWWLN